MSRSRRTKSEALAPDAQQFLERMRAIRAQAKERLEELQSRELDKEIEAKLAAHPKADSIEVRKVVAVLRKLRCSTETTTQAERRRMEIIRMSLAGSPVAEIAEALGLSYYYVVQLRRELGLSKPRRKA